MNNKRTWIVLGGTCVIGRSFAREAAKAGHDIILLGKLQEDYLKMEIELSVVIHPPSSI